MRGLKKISAKRLKKLGGKPVWSSISKRSSVRKTNPKRKKAEFARTYHSKQRVEFVKSLPCAACGHRGYSVNAHIENGGMGRKANFDRIIPLCGPTKTETKMTTTYYIGCHYLFDEQRYNFDIAYPRFNPEAIAAETESRWLAFSDSPRTGMQE